MLKPTTSILLGIALALGLGVAVIELGPMRQRQERLASQDRLLEFDPSTIQALSLSKFNGDTPIGLERQDDTWTLVQPVETAAETITVQTLLNALATADADLVSEQETDLAPFGLDEPQQTIELMRGDGTAQVLKLGGLTFDNAGVYAQVDDGAIAILPTSLQSQLSPSLFALRDKTLAAWPTDDLATLRVRTPGESIDLERQNNRWQLQHATLVDADREALDRLLNQLSLLQASTFEAEVKDDLMSFGLDSPAIEITGTTTSGDALMVSVGKAIDSTLNSRYVMSSTNPAIASIPSATVDTWPKTLFELRDKSLGAISPSTLGQVDIKTENPKQSHLFTRRQEETGDAEQWLRQADEERPLSLARLFQAISQIRALEFRPMDDPVASTALTSPLVTIELTPRDEIAGEPTVVNIARTADGSVWARSSARPELLEIDASDLEELEGAIAALELVDASEATTDTDNQDASDDLSPSGDSDSGE